MLYGGPYVQDHTVNSFCGILPEKCVGPPQPADELAHVTSSGLLVAGVSLSPGRHPLPWPLSSICPQSPLFYTI